MSQCCVAGTMQKHAGLLTTMCVLMCLAVNYTFPLNRDIKFTTSIFRRNTSNTYLPPSCTPLDQIYTKTDRTKTFENIEEAPTKLKTSAQHAYHGATDKKLSDEDLRQYEQLVIMKKYPYLDLKELEYKLHSAGKNTRQTLKEYSGINRDANEPGIYEPADNLNVEICNRGLSGFTIPRKFVKSLTAFSRLKESDVKVLQQKIEVDKSVDKSQDTLRNLRNYIEAYLHN